MKALIFKIGTVTESKTGHKLKANGWVFQTNDDWITSTENCGWKWPELVSISSVEQLFGEEEAFKLAAQLARGSK